MVVAVAISGKQVVCKRFLGDTEKSRFAIANPKYDIFFLNCEEIAKNNEISFHLKVHITYWRLGRS